MAQTKKRTQEHLTAVVAVEVVPEDKEVEEIAIGLTECDNWSKKIRYLASKGFKNSTISHILSELRGYPLSQQHVNNVLQRPLKLQGRSKQDPRAQRLLQHLKD